MLLLKFLVQISGGHRARRARRLTALLAFLAMNILLIPAHGQIAPPDDGKVEERFPLPAPETENAGDGLDIYIDGSMSMRGYVASSDSNYSRIVREVVQSATVAQFDLRVYKFATSITPVTHLPMSQVQSSDFYNGRDTPLAAILNRLAESPGRSAIIITDMVQSQSGTDSLVLAKALSRLSIQTHEIKLLAYRSSFSGAYYPESHRGPALKLAATQSLPDTGRPFYMLAVTPNGPSMKRLDSYVLSRVPPVEMITPSAPAVSVEDIDLSRHGAQELPWRLYKPSVQKNARIRRIISAFRLTRMNGAEDFLPLDLKIKTSIPIRRPSELNYEISRVTWGGAGRFEQLSQVDMPVTGSSTKDGTALQLQFTIHRPGPASWDIYLIRMRPGQGNLDVPPWVNAWTTDDDSAVSAGNRTFQLKLIVQSMINSVTENRAFLEYILEVGR